jgi:hypothetical protein
MTLTRGQGRAASSVSRRVTWLQENSDICSSSDDRFVFLAMKAAGLFAKNTYWKDVNIRQLVNLAKESAE